MSKIELRRSLAAFEELRTAISGSRDARLDPRSPTGKLVESLPALAKWKDVDVMSTSDGSQPSAETASLLALLRPLAKFMAETGARKSAQTALSALIDLLDRHQPLDIEVLLERAATEARHASSKVKSSGRKMSKTTKSASALVEQLSDFSQPLAEADKLLDQLASRQTAKTVVLDVAKRLTGARYQTKTEAVDALRRWRWQWARTRSVSKAIASGA